MLALSFSQRSDVIGHSYRFGRYVGIAHDLRIDRNEIIFAFELHSVTADIDERDGVRPRRCGFLQKIAKGAAQRVLIEITRADNIEAGRLEGLCDQARIVGRRRKRSDLIAGIGFRAFTLDGVQFFVFEQRRRQVAEFSVVLDDQYGSTFLLPLPHD
jgi:hypothetical protein